MEETAYKIDVPDTGEVQSGVAPEEEIIEPISLLLLVLHLKKVRNYLKNAVPVIIMKKTVPIKLVLIYGISLTDQKLM